MANNGPDLRAFFAQVMGEIDNVIESVAADAVDVGADAMRERIETFGTQNSWDDSWDTMRNATPGRYQSSPGRVASGSMLKGVDGKTTSVGSHAVEGRFGWLGDVEDYWMYQEYGFHHSQANKLVWGMNALGDAEDQVIDFLDRELDTRLGRII